MAKNNKVTDCEHCPVFARLGVERITVWKKGRAETTVLNREIPFKGNPNAKIAFVGESPGAEELQQGKCFVGASGRTVDVELLKHHIRPEDVFWGNACRCHLDKATLTEKEINRAIDCCRPMIDRVLRQIKPKIIVPFGNIALKSISKMSGITNKRGKFIWSQRYNCYVFPMYHPAYCLRDNTHFTLWRPDMKQLATFVKQGYKPLSAAKTVYQEADSIASLLEQKQPLLVGIDTETQGTAWADSNFVVISYAISDKAGRASVIRLHEEVATKREADFTIQWERTCGRKKERVPVYVRRCRDFERKVSELAELCKRNDILKVTFHGAFDRHAFETLGITEFAGFRCDVQLALHLLDPDVFRGVSLADAQRYLLPETFDYKGLFSRENKTDMLAVGKKSFLAYAAADADITRRCAIAVYPLIKRHDRVRNYYSRFLIPVTNEVLFDIERNGVFFDTKKLPEVKTALAEQLKEMAKTCLSYAPDAVLRKHAADGGAEALRLTRTDLVRDILFSKEGFGLRPIARTKTGEAAAADRKSLRHLRDTLEPDSAAYNFISEYLAWGPYKTLYNTYLKGFEQAVRSDGKLHPSVSTIWTATGRTASHEPNTQNIPKRNPEIATIIRSLIVAAPGYKFVAKDYAGAELRWVAHRSRDPLFIKTFRENGDLHLVTAQRIAQLAGKRWDKLSEAEKKKWRQSAKSVNFGFLYGLYPRGFVAYARDEYGLQISEEAAKEWRNGFFELYTGLAAWHEREIAFARRNGYCETDFGRRRQTPNINSDDFQARIEDEHVALNTPIQGASSDAGLLGCLTAKRAGLLDNKRARLVLFIHDELIWEVEEDYVQQFSEAMDDYLVNLPTEQFGFKLRVPLATETTVGDDLGHMEALR